MRPLRRGDLHLGRAAAGAAAPRRGRSGRRHRGGARLRPLPPRRGGGQVKPLLVLDVVGLTPRLLTHMPHLQAVADRGFQATLHTVLPAVTCTVQSTFLTGETPTGHGIVGNGWYFRDLGEVLLWRQHNALV